MRYKGIIILLYTFISCGSNENQKVLDSIESNINTVFSIKVTAVVDSKFGYQIYRNDTLMIDQYEIPAISGNKGFVSYDEAQIIAELVVKKLSKGIFPPEILISELINLGITF